MENHDDFIDAMRYSFEALKHERKKVKKQKIKNYLIGFGISLVLIVLIFFLR